jgi:hypothetical protein
MMNRSATKAQITHMESMSIIAAQDAARDKKTSQLRELRLARDAERAATIPLKPVKARRKRTAK